MEKKALFLPILILFLLPAVSPQEFTNFEKIKSANYDIVRPSILNFSANYYVMWTNFNQSSTLSGFDQDWLEISADTVPSDFPPIGRPTCTDGVFSGIPYSPRDCELGDVVDEDHAILYCTLRYSGYEWREFGAFEYEFSTGTFSLISEFVAGINPRGSCASIYGRPSKYENGTTGSPEVVLALITDGVVRRAVDNLTTVDSYPIAGTLIAIYDLYHINYDHIRRCFGGGQTYECGAGLVHVADYGDGNRYLYTNEYKSDALCPTANMCMFFGEFTRVHRKRLTTEIPNEQINLIGDIEERDLFYEVLYQNMTGEYKVARYDPQWYYISTKELPSDPFQNFTVLGRIDSTVGSEFYVLSGQNISDNTTELYKFEELPPCECTAWQSDICVGDYRKYTRSCTPEGCDITVKYEEDPTCVANIFTQFYQSSCESSWGSTGTEVSCETDPIQIAENCTNVQAEEIVTLRWEYSDACAGTYEIQACVPYSECNVKLHEDPPTCADATQNKDYYSRSYTGYRGGDTATGRGVGEVINCGCRGRYRVETDLSITCDLPCFEGWVCVDANHRAFGYENCTTTNITTCQYGCSNGQCLTEEGLLAPEPLVGLGDLVGQWANLLLILFPTTLTRLLVSIGTIGGIGTYVAKETKSWEWAIVLALALVLLFTFINFLPSWIGILLIVLAGLFLAQKFRQVVAGI